MYRRSILLIAALGLATAVATPAQTPDSSVLAGLTWRPLGPATMAGRVADVEGVPGDAAVVYVGSASGGVWKTMNGGVDWMPIFDDQPIASIGDIALEPGNPDVIYVGTGEANTRNSVSFGNGIYKSTDGGKSWKHLGLADSERISRVVVSPGDPALVFVAAVGHAFGPNTERGVFVSRDAGETWERTLYVDEHHGASDLDVNPDNPNVVFAGMWRFERKPWTFTSGGTDGGVFRSTDGGRTWSKLTNGLPRALGRVGVKVAPGNPKVVYVIAESNEGTLFRSDDGGDTFTRVSSDPNIVNRGFYFTDIRVDPVEENRVYALAGSMLRSFDGGKTFTVFSASTHGDYHALWIDPTDPRRMWQGDDGGVGVSYDRGDTWDDVSNFVLAQFYQLTADNREPFYYMGGGLQDNGSWFGPSRTREPAGIFDSEWKSISYGDGYWVAIHPDDPDLFLSEFQGGGIVRTNMRTRDQLDVSPQPRRNDGGPVVALEYRFNWNAPIVQSPHDGKTVYFGGNVLFRSSDFGLTWDRISPDLTSNDPAKHGVAGGPVWFENTTAEYHTTIISIAESPVVPGVLWVGTDDGNLHVSRDSGETWASVMEHVRSVGPLALVTHVEASRTSPGKAYASFDRHMFDDFAPHVAVTEDFGRTWRDLSGDLPAKAYVHVVREDPRNLNLLYVGTELGIFASWSGGTTWVRLHLGNLPTVAVHEILVHPRENDLIVATHGRGIWILDDASPVQRLAAASTGATHLFPVRPALRFAMRETTFGIGDRPHVAPNPPYGALITYHLPSALDSAVTPTLEILTEAGEIIRTLHAVPMTPGLNRTAWDLNYDGPTPRTVTPADSAPGPTAHRGPRAVPGRYVARLTVGADTVTTPVEVRLDPLVNLSAGDLRAQHDASRELTDLISAVNDALRELDQVRTQLQERTKLARGTAAEREIGIEIDSLRVRLDTLHRELARPDSVAFWSVGWRLVERLSALMIGNFGIIGGIDGPNAPPTSAQLEYLVVLRGETQNATDRVRRFLQDDVTHLNRALERHELPPIRVVRRIS